MPPFSLPTSARVAVVGAGLAGSNVARVLCAAGHEVHLYDQASAVAQGASGNALGAFHPHITRGDSPLSQLSRLGHDMTLHTLFQLSQQGLLQQGVDWDTPGHLQTVPPAEVVHTQETLAQLGFPGTTVHWAEPGQYAPGPLGGLYFPRGGWVKPPRWVQANLQACGHRLHLHLGQQIASLEQLRRTHDAVVVACAQGSQLLAPVVGAAPGVVKGQITQVAFQHDGLPVLSGESYAIAPSGLGIAIVGATYERPVLDLNPSDEADALNLGRFAAAFPSLQLGPVLGRRCAVRFVWHDRLPVVGPLPGSPGVYWCSAFASRGILWAALAAWWLGEHMAGHPLSTRLLNRMLPRPAGKGA